MAAVWEEFQAAMQVLVGCGPVKQRLIDAWRDHLARCTTRTCRRRCVRTSAPCGGHARGPAAGGMGAAEVSVRKMSERTRRSMPCGVLDMHLQLVSNEPTPAPAAPAHRRRHAPGGCVRGLPAFLSRA